MRILKSVVDTIDRSIADTPPETGGILGSHGGGLIDEVVMDLPAVKNTRPCSYYPNVEFLNHTIELWQKNGISFLGIFHSHFVGVRTLSGGDLRYIKAIMEAMPSTVDSLYFPVFVLPDRELVCYRAQKNGGAVEITREPVHLVEQ